MVIADGPQHPETRPDYGSLLGKNEQVLGLKRTGGSVDCLYWLATVMRPPFN